MMTRRKSKALERERVYMTTGAQRIARRTLRQEENRMSSETRDGWERTALGHTPETEREKYERQKREAHIAEVRTAAGVQGLQAKVEADRQAKIALAEAQAKAILDAAQAEVAAQVERERQMWVKANGSDALFDAKACQARIEAQRAAVMERAGYRPEL
jgi:hypothetical protein